MKQSLTPLLLTGEEPEAGEALRRTNAACRGKNPLARKPADGRRNCESEVKTQSTNTRFEGETE
jgi:hypothetical protein